MNRLYGLFFIGLGVAAIASGQALDGTSLLEGSGDLAAEMVDGIGRFLDRGINASVAGRAQYWKRDLSSWDAYESSVEPNRERLKRIIGAHDERLAPSMEYVATTAQPALVGKGAGFQIFAVRWPVFDGVYGEGLLLEPDATAVANVIALPDCDWSPEQLTGLEGGVPSDTEFARRLAESGCRVIVPVLISRACTWSGRPNLRMTSLPHREYIYRPAYEMGNHIIGYEVQKVCAAVDWFEREHAGEPVAAVGYGEGGLVAFYAAAVDTRIQSVAVSGYFRSRQLLWQEPIYRNVWGLLEQFGDAEIASLIAPRRLYVEASHQPDVQGPPQMEGRGNSAAPGMIETPGVEEVQEEAARARNLLGGLAASWEFHVPTRPDAPLGAGEAHRGIGMNETLESLVSGVRLIPGGTVESLVSAFDSDARMQRQVGQLMEHTQELMRQSEFVRREFWSKADATSVETWQQTSQWYRDYLWDDVIGRFPEPTGPINPRSRLVFDEPEFRGYEVVLDVYPTVFAYGILLVPKDLNEGERRPVVVCQHGLEGRAQDVADPAHDSHYYHQFACALARQGFITYAPQNPYIGEDAFRVLQRKANPLKRSLFSIIVRQHERTLEWLGALPFVDKDRIGFYGLSYGGKTAMRVPALLEGYCLSICSADYDEWIWKNVSDRHAFSYIFTGEYEMPEFDLGNTFNYAELSWLVCPRPFMVERGHHDGVAPDEWVGYEFAKTYRRYNLLGIGDRAEIEWFDGPHTIHGVGTFEFLKKHLNWP